LGALDISNEIGGGNLSVPGRRQVVRGTSLVLEHGEKCDADGADNQGKNHNDDE
jgi:hypothetical protein